MEASQSDIVNEPVGDVVISPAIASLVDSANIANLTAIIQQLVREEIQKILASFQAAKNFTLNLASSDESAGPVVIKQQEEKPVVQQADKKPVYFLPRRPGYYPPPPPYYYGSQQPLPYYNEQPYPLYRSEGAYGGPQWRRINPTNDESLTDLEALAELELLLNEKEDVISDAEARGIMSSLSSTTNSAKASFKSFVNSLRSIPSALPSAFPSFNIVKKTYLVPGLAISG